MLCLLGGGVALTLFLTDQEVKRALSLRDAVEAVQDGFRQHGLGLAQTLPRREVRIRGKELPHADPRMVRVAQGLAFLEESRVVVVHHILAFPDRTSPSTRIVNYLIDASDGHVMAVIDSASILGMRTGAAGAVGARFLSKKDSSVAGIVGTGRQGRIQLRFLPQARPIKKAYAYSLAPRETQKFCEEMGAELGINVLAAESVEETVREADILVTATQSTIPFVKSEWLPPGLHVNIIGADDPPKIEVEGAALRRANKLVIAAEDCLAAGQMRIPIQDGTIRRDNIYGTIGEIVAGIKPGRERNNEITIFHSPGVTLQDAAVGHKAYLKAKELGLGIDVPDPFYLR